MKYKCCGHCEKPCPKDGHSKPCKACAELRRALGPVATTSHFKIVRATPW